MKAAPLAPAIALAALGALATFAPAAKADDTVRACIAASTDGQTLRKQGKLLASREEMIACARDACPAIVRSHCARWLAEVDEAIPSLVIRAEDASGADMMGARVAIDARPVKLDGKPVRLDPGAHTVTVSDPNGARREERVLLAEGESSRVVTVRFPPAGGAAPATGGSPPPATTTTTRHVPAGAWVLGGLGIVALGAATYFGIAANNELNQLNGTCSPHCVDSQTQTGRTDALLFDVLLGTGAAAVAGSLLWALAFPSHSTTVTALVPRLELRPVAGGALSTFVLSY